MAAFQNLCIHIDVARGPAGPVLAGPLFSAEFFFLRGGGGGGATHDRTHSRSFDEP